VGGLALFLLRTEADDELILSLPILLPLSFSNSSTEVMLILEPIKVIHK